MYGDHDADEAPEDEMDRKRSESHGKSPVPEREQGVDQYDRAVYGRSGIDHADGRSHPDTECSEGTKERRERESVCGGHHASYAAAGCDADSLQKSL